jgi:hypothetical protein
VHRQNRQNLFPVSFEGFVGTRSSSSIDLALSRQGCGKRKEEAEDDRPQDCRLAVDPRGRRRRAGAVALRPDQNCAGRPASTSIANGRSAGRRLATPLAIVAGRGALAGCPTGRIGKPIRLGRVLINSARPDEARLMSGCPPTAAKKRTSPDFREGPIPDVSRLFDHLVGTHQQRGRNFKTERPELAAAA